MEVPQNRLCLRMIHYRGQGGGIGLSHRLQAAKVLQQPTGSQGADSGDFQQLGFTIANFPALAMKRHRESVSLIAYKLHQVQHR